MVRVRQPDSKRGEQRVFVEAVCVDVVLPVAEVRMMVYFYYKYVFV